MKWVLLNGVLIFLTLQISSITAFSRPSVTQITDPIDHSEGPTWDGRKNILYFVDIHTGRVFSYNYFTAELNFVKLDGQLTPAIPSKNNEDLIIVGLDRSVFAIEWDGANNIRRIKNLTTVSNQFPGSRMNDGKADKNGRLWIGTMGAENTATGELVPDNGVFYKIEKDNLDNPSVEIAPVNISNGIAWNKANDKLYYIDTPTRKVVEYDYDGELGTISNPRVAVDVANFTGITGNPDGMTIDKDDNLWIALYGGGSIIKANPTTGELLQVVAIPARDVTSAMWGGPNLDILFVTTSRVSLNAEERLVYPFAGSVFAVTNLGTNGLPVFNVDLIDEI